ncbi:neurexin-1-like [Actinia tenebrosa]|uniref:Neurexin-1-like n=1 Tax=Actinia tenebrosa TaxID=6105 RepID=A0A6P8IST9_ACTTE|nr:neurexin-1-like [Actinia tenebrosa]
MPNTFFIFVLVLTFAKQTISFVDDCFNCPNSTLKYNKPLSYSVYDPGWSLINNGALEVWFRTGMKNAMVVYEDDGGKGEFFDVFLVGGKIRMRMQVGYCNIEKRVINGSFNDLKWHKLVIRKEKKNTTLSVDSIAAEPIQCSSQLDSMTALYTGHLSIFVRESSNSWTFPSSLWQSINNVFQGCIKDIQYVEDGVITRPHLRATVGTERGCSNPCQSLKCRHGGRCVDRILTAWCNCEGTGYQGKRCARVIKNRSTKPPTTKSLTTKKITYKVKDPNKIPLLQKEREVSAINSRIKNIGVHHGRCMDLWAVATATVLGMAINT